MIQVPPEVKETLNSTEGISEQDGKDEPILGSKFPSEIKALGNLEATQGTSEVNHKEDCIPVAFE